jgi:MYXO-CTERM domain-containing protein
MRRSSSSTLTGPIVACTGLLISCIVEQTPSGPDEPNSIPMERVQVPTADVLNGILQYPHGAACGGSRINCFARVRTDENGVISPHAVPSMGYAATDVQSAYGIDPTWNTGATVVLIDAYGYSSLEDDLATYRGMYGLPACTSANGCLTIVNQEGGASPLPSPPPSNDDWTIETALDVDMVSAGCPNCKIVVVQADDDRSDGLLIANSTAVSMGATVISNSWGGPENMFGTLEQSESYFNHPGVAVFVAAGDNGYDDGGQGPDYPSTSAYTIGVGGTSLAQGSDSRGWTETAWRSGGSSCSTSITKPSWQTSNACGHRMTSDLSAVGDPNTGVAVYDSVDGGWQVVGGTSAASPLIAAIYAATGHGNATAQFAYQNPSAFHDVTSGTNGSCGPPLCSAGTGWDGPTGVGTPIAPMLKSIASGPGSGSGSGSNLGQGSGSSSGAGNDGVSYVDHANCSTGSGSGSAMLLVVAAGAFARRRRR